MNRTKILAAAVRILSNETNLIYKPTPLEAFITEFIGGESYDVTVAKQIESDLDRASAALKRARINRKFKKITKNV